MSSSSGRRFFFKCDLEMRFFVVVGNLTVFVSCVTISESHGKYFIENISVQKMPSLCMFWFYSKGIVESFTRKTNENRCHSNYVFFQSKSFRQTLS